MKDEDTHTREVAAEFPLLPRVAPTWRLPDPSRFGQRFLAQRSNPFTLAPFYTCFRARLLPRLSLHLHHHRREPKRASEAIFTSRAPGPNVLSQRRSSYSGSKTHNGSFLQPVVLESLLGTASTDRRIFSLMKGFRGLIRVMARWAIICMRIQFLPASAITS